MSNSYKRIDRTKNIPRGKKWVKAWAMWFLVDKASVFITAEETMSTTAKGLLVVAWTDKPIFKSLLAYPEEPKAWYGDLKGLNVATPTRYTRSPLRAKDSIRVIQADGTTKPMSTKKGGGNA